VDFTLIPQGSSAVNFLRQLGGAIGVSATGIFLQWRLASRGIETVHGAAVDPEARILAFDETFIFLRTLCALAVVAAWRLPAQAAARGASRRSGCAIKNRAHGPVSCGAINQSGRRAALQFFDQVDVLLLGVVLRGALQAFPRFVLVAADDVGEARLVAVGVAF